MYLPPQKLISKTATVLALLACLAASAPGAMADQNHPTVRVTTGSVQINGWEQSLVRGDPNLRHWHWNPIYANVQGTQRLSPMNVKNLTRKNGPNKNVTFTPAASPIHRTSYFMPIKVPFTPHPQPQLQTAPLPQVSAVMSHKDVNANLMHRDVNANLMHRDVSANLMHKDVSGNLMHRDVSGQLANRDVNGTLLTPAQPAPPAAPPVPAPPTVATYSAYQRGDDFAAVASRNSQIERSSVYGKVKQSRHAKATY